MPNIQDHAIEIGQAGLAERPFDVLDSLILTQLVYMPMEGLADEGKGLTVKEVWAYLKDNLDPQTLDQFQQKRYRLTEVCAELPRYRDWYVHDYINHIDDELETQFCAAVYDLPDGTLYIAFRGTDLTIAGWKEDLNMSFMVVPAQEESVSYIEQIAQKYEGAMELGGHSKGGNLAVYAACYCDEVAQRRIRRVCSFDGPGMNDDFMHCTEYLRVKDKIESFIPQSSVVGMLMNYHPVYTVVEARSLGILQHDAMTWQVRDGKFAELDGLDMSGKITDETLHAWLATMDRDERRTLVQTVYQVVDAAQAELVTDLAEDWWATATKVLEAVKGLNPEMRKNVGKMLHALFSTGASEVVRAVLPNLAQNGLKLREIIKPPADKQPEEKLLEDGTKA